MSNDHEHESERQEIVFVPEDSVEVLQPCANCEESREAAAKVVAANADVVRVAGYSIASSPPLILMFSWIDSLIKNYPWHPDERILLALVGAFGSLVFYLYKQRGPST